MSDQLFPEDILSDRDTLRTLAMYAKAEADVEDTRAQERQRDAEGDVLAEQALEFMLDTLQLPEHMVEDVAFKVETLTPGRAVVSWTIDEIELRCRPAGTIDSGLTPYFEVRVTKGYQKSWSAFTSLASLGRLLDA